MRRAINSVFYFVLLAGVLVIRPAPAAIGAELDGTWSVLIITEKGDCDRAYRYAVKVANGRVSYQGDAAVDMAGTVTPNGAVKVSIRLGDKGANGTGHLSERGGTGTWHGAAANSTCAGRWEAERR
jgi:hypothetical protein